MSQPPGEGAVVFVGPSLERSAVAAALPAALVAPPIARGDLRRLRADGASTFLILDGVFAQRLSVAPSEIVDALAAGASVIGAASLGAIRASECRPAGMVGVGAVYRLFRLGVLRDDDEVAVATDPDRDFRSLSVALIVIRFFVLSALRAGLLGRRQAEAVLAAAVGTHFAERRWQGIFATAGVEPSAALLALRESADVKRRDAELALKRMSQEMPPAGDMPEAGRGGEVSPVRRAANRRRYRGHDPLLGRHEPELRRELATWLVRSGRWRRYFADPPAAAGDRRSFEAAAWARLDDAGELHRELMRWYAAEHV